MTADILARDVLLYCVQITLLIASGIGAARLLNLREPKAMLAYWRTLLFVCVALPLLQPWHAAALPAPIAFPAGSLVDATPAAPSPLSAPSTWPLDQLLLSMLAAGVVVRGLWLMTTAVGLQRLRKSASSLSPLPAPMRIAAESVGVHADVRVSKRVTGPITFGVHRPVIVVPPEVLAFDESVQEAIVCHELLHVRRRDWLDQIGEETLRTIFWFHPVVRWLIGRIQLTREQVVDRAAIELTQSRDRYVDALMAVALAQPRIAAFVPAPLFLRKRSLKHRINSLFQERTMSTRRLIVSLAVSAAALAVVAAVSVRAFPLEAQPAAPAQPVQIVAGGEHLLHAALPEYPRAAIEGHVEGDVVLQLGVDDRGNVTDARVINGPDELRKTALRAVLEWHFSPASVRSTLTQATIRFTLPPEGTYKFEGRLVEYRENQAEGEQKGEMSPAQKLEHFLDEAKRALEDPGTSGSQREEIKGKVAEATRKLEEIREQRRAGGEEPVLVAQSQTESFEGVRTLTQIRSERVSDAALKEFVAQLGVKIGDQINAATARKVLATASRIDEHLRVGFFNDGKGGVVLTVIAP